MSLKRMGAVGATLFVAGNMIGSGIYLLPAALGAVGSITLISWLIAGAGAVMLALAFAMLGVIRPGADGAVSYVAEGLGPVFGHLGWFSYQVSNWTGTPAVAVAAVGYLAYFFPALKTPLIGAAGTIGLLWLGVGAGLVGPRLVSRLSGATLLIGLAPVAVAIVVGVLAFSPHTFAASWNVSGKPDFTAATSAVLPVFWAYLGLETANMVAAGIDNPRRNLAIAALGGVALATVIYVAASVAVMGLLPASALAASTAPFADAIVRVAGPVSAALVAACAAFKAFGTAVGWTLVTAEADRAAAAAGFLPRFVSEIDPDRRPVRDLLFLGVLMTAVVLVTVSPTLGRQFSVIINVSVIATMIQYLLCSAALIRLAGRGDHPGLVWPSRLAGLAGVLFSGWVIVTMDPSLRAPTAGILAASLALYGLHLLAKRRAVAA